MSSAQMLFQVFHKHPVPHLPIGSDGSSLEPDGKRLLSLIQASERFTLPQETLRLRYQHAFAGLFSAREAYDLGIGVESKDQEADDEEPPIEPVLLQQYKTLRYGEYPHLSEEAFALFLRKCLERGIDPYSGHAVAEYAYDHAAKRMRLHFIVKISWLKLVAERTGKYRGRTQAHFLNADEQWVKVWTESGHPVAARVGVYREGFKKVVWGLARWKAYAPAVELSEGNFGLPAFWERFDAEQLAKCAFAAALRDAFPEVDMPYCQSEMFQALQRNNGKRSNGEAARQPDPDDQRAYADVEDQRPAEGAATYS